MLALRGQTAPAESFEVIVAADGGDRDGALAECVRPSAQPFACRIVAGPRPRGDVPHKNHARNAGVAAARARLVWVLDADFILDAHAIEHLVAESRRALNAGRIALFTPTLVGMRMPPASWLEVSQSWAESGDPAMLSRLLDSVDIVNNQYSGFGHSYRPGAARSEPCIGLREGFPTLYRSLWEALDGYDEHFVGWGGNKQELVQRLLRLQALRLMSIRLLTSVRAIHQPHARDASASTPQRQANRAYYRRRLAEVRRSSAWWEHQLLAARKSIAAELADARARRTYPPASL